MKTAVRHFKLFRLSAIPQSQICPFTSRTLSQQAFQSYDRRSCNPSCILRGQQQLPRMQRGTARAKATQSERAAPTSTLATTAEEQKNAGEGAGVGSGVPSWEIKMLYDGACPLCMREVDMLKRRDAGVGKISFVDIAAEDYSPKDNAGIDFEEAMGTIHAILPDGEVVKNVEVFRRLYEAVGLGWIYAITKVAPVAKFADMVYGVWAKYRLPITGRPDISIILQEREKKTCR